MLCGWSQPHADGLQALLWRPHHRNLIIQVFLTVSAAADNESPEPRIRPEWLSSFLSFFLSFLLSFFLSFQFSLASGIYGIPDCAWRRYFNLLPITPPLMAHLGSSQIASSSHSNHHTTSSSTTTTTTAAATLVNGFPINCFSWEPACHQEKPGSSCRVKVDEGHPNQLEKNPKILEGSL